MATKNEHFERLINNSPYWLERLYKNSEYPKRVKLKYMPLDHWDRERGFSHCTGWEVLNSPDIADWWYEYVDSETGETFLAR